eukprot:7652893-Alexandrium_andersonii.AAC.1
MRSSFTSAGELTQHLQGTRASGSSTARACARGYYSGEQTQGSLIAGDTNELGAVEGDRHAASTCGEALDAERGGSH